MNHALGICLHCIGEYMQKKIIEAKEAAANDGGDGSFQLTAEELEQNCHAAITLAPTWQGMMVGPGSQVFGCVAVPTCPVHLVAQTPQQSGRSGSGLLVPGNMN